MKIFTITLNPAFDIHAYTDAFTPFSENLVHLISRDAGGKGVNVSRALTSMGVENTALIVLGKDNGSSFKDSLIKDRIDCIFLEVDGRIRENITLHCKDTPETRISFSGFSINEDILKKIPTILLVNKGDIIVFSGRIPEGVSVDSVKKLLNEFKSKGARLVLDSKSFAPDDIFSLSPYLIKPNCDELSEYVGLDIESIEDAIDAAKIFSDKGIENIMVSLGEKGAILINGSSCYIATPPKISPLSTVGAGDSSIAGFLVSATNQREVSECLKNAVAFGTAACLTSGSLPPEKNDIANIYSQVLIKKSEV